jgi:GxxExxY protein
MKNQSPPVFKKESYSIIGAAMAVHRELGCGFLESVYQESLEEELKIESIPYTREVQLDVHYKDKLLSKSFKADFLCYDKVIIELKACSSLDPSHYSQLVNYLKASNHKLGLLINFGKSSLEYKRIINTHVKL